MLKCNGYIIKIFIIFGALSFLPLASAQSINAIHFNDNYTTGNYGVQNNLYVDRTGLYLQGNVGTNFATFSWFGMHYSKLGGVGLNAILGYQYNDYLGIEGGYTYYSIKSFLTTGLNVLNAAVTLSFPFGPLHRFVIFGKLGPAYAYNKYAGGPFLYGGIGAGYAINSKIDLVIQTQGETVSVVSFALISAGLTYHF